MSNGLEKSAAWLKKKFVEDRKTLTEMATEAKCSERTIRRALKELGLL